MHEHSIVFLLLTNIILTSCQFLKHDVGMMWYYHGDPSTQNTGAIYGWAFNSIYIIHQHHTHIIPSCFQKNSVAMMWYYHMYPSARNTVALYRQRMGMQWCSYDSSISYPHHVSFQERV